MDFGVSPLDGLPLPSRVTICEVGPHDGLSHESAVLPTDVKVEFVTRLVEAGVSVLETAGVDRPEWCPQVADAEELLRRISPVPDVRHQVVVADRRGLSRALDLGVRDVTVSASVTEVLAPPDRRPADTAPLARLAPVVDLAREAGLQVRGHLAMCFGDPWEGKVSPLHVLDAATRMKRLGCTGICVGDTIGVATPGRVTAVLDALVASGLGVDEIAVHFHDTYGQGAANTLTALRRGITTFETAAGGLGGCPMRAPPRATSPPRTCSGSSTASASGPGSTCASSSPRVDGWPAGSAAPPLPASSTR
jgi:hydroxymethylglutaryl-CoA lyase